MNNTKRSVFLIAVWISVAGLLLVAAISTSVDANPYALSRQLARRKRRLLR